MARDMTGPVLVVADRAWLLPWPFLALRATRFSVATV